MGFLHFEIRMYVSSMSLHGLLAHFFLALDNRVNVNILGISELKWTGMGEFNSDDHYIYYCGQESLRRNGVALIVNKRLQNAVLG